jgi:hypothetical protein
VRLLSWGQASKGGGIARIKRILALAVAAGVVAGGGAALAAGNGSSNSQSPAATTGKSTTTPRNSTAPQHNCPNMGSGSNSNMSYGL